MRGAPGFAGFQSFQNDLDPSGSGHQLNPWHSDYSKHSCRQTFLPSFRCNLDEPGGNQTVRGGRHKVFCVDSSELRPHSATFFNLEPSSTQKCSAQPSPSPEVSSGLGSETGSDSSEVSVSQISFRVKGSHKAITGITIVQMENEFSDCQEGKHFRIGFLRGIYHFDLAMVVNSTFGLILETF